MPRPRVKDEDRKRVARACDTCKRRKEKCDGQQPCLLCKRRGREPECTFSDGFTRRGSSKTHSNSLDSSTHQQHSSHRVQRENSMTETPSALKEGFAADSSDAEIAIESLLTLSGGSRSAPKTPQIDGGLDDMLMSRAPVPKLARLLRDGHGKFVFVGDSSNLAFIQNIRRLVKSEIGDCALTSDPLRHAMVEAIPIQKTGSKDNHHHHHHQPTKPSVQEARELGRQFLLAASGAIDLFDPEEMLESLCAWASNPNAETDVETSVYYFVVAIGISVRQGGTQQQAEYYYNRGRELIMADFMDDPSVLMVQAYVLITFYMLTVCRRNGAFMLLGLAVRAAYALGLHRSDISNLFEPKERKTRERTWKSLRVLDLYMSASLGRPPATSEVDGGSISWDRSSRDYEAIQMGGLNSSAMLRICFIFERILNEVYCRREVSVQLVESISRQYRDWTMHLPAGLKVDGLESKLSLTTPSLQQAIGVAHLKGAYYWSIILLTRPFLIFKVASKIKGHHEGEEGASSVTSTLSEACIDAALRSIEIATDLIHTAGIPKRLFMITNSTLVAAMVVGFAIFGDFDKTFPLLSSIDQAERILSLMAKDDPSARRYEQITSNLRLAALEHIRRRDHELLEKRRVDINHLFGDPAAKKVSQLKAHPRSIPNTDIEALASVTDPTGLKFLDGQDPAWQLRLDMPVEGRGPVLTTSGALATFEQDANQALPEFPFYLGPDMGPDLTSPLDSGIPSIPSYAEEFPLFSLMTDDFDPLQGPFPMGIT